MQRPLTAYTDPSKPPLNLKAFEQAGGYRAIRKPLGSMAPQEVTAMMKESYLRGRAGAGFPTGQKWSFAPMDGEALRPIYLVVNADEIEPVTFKDCLILEGNPHQLVEGIIQEAYAAHDEIAYTLLRYEYRLAVKFLNAAIAEFYAANYVGHNILGTDYSLELYQHRSAGRIGRMAVCQSTGHYQNCQETGSWLTYLFQ